jgi:hypothetical protein
MHGFSGESLHTPYLSPYLKALGADFRNGVNFAIGGSTATPGGSPFSLDVQLHQWLYFRVRSMEMINLGPFRMNNLLSHPRFFS